MNGVWNDIGSIADIPQRGSRIIKRADACIAVFRTADDKIHVLEDKCPHKNGPLSQGIVHDHFVTCPLHNWVFDLTSGKATGADEGEVRTYPVKIESGRILVMFSAATLATAS